MDHLFVRPIRPDDVDVLGKAFKDPHFVADRLIRQKNGLGVLFTAWSGHSPVGILYVWLEEAEEPEIADKLPGVALLTHLEVPEAQRGRGIGSELVGHAERYLAAHDHERVALAVRTDNHDAARLYKRLGYEQWDHYEIVCHTYEVQPDDSVVRRPEVCYVLVKELKPAPRP